MRTLLMNAAAVALVTCAAMPAAAQWKHYTVTDAGSAPNGADGMLLRSYDLSSAGDVLWAGSRSIGGGRDESVYSINGQLRSIRSTDEYAKDVNAKGDVVGFYQKGQTFRAYHYSGGVRHDMGPLAFRGSPSPRATYHLSVNEKGWAAGTTDTWGQVEHAFLYRDGQMIDIGAAWGRSINSFAHALNERGDVVADYSTRFTFKVPFMYRDGVATAVQGFDKDSFHTAEALNEKGQFVGNAWLRPSRSYESYLYSDGEVIDLGLGSDFDNTTAKDLNNHGVVVGEGYLAAWSPRRAFIWQDGEMMDLQALLLSQEFTLLDAGAINDAGQILALGQHLETGEQRLLLLNPVPEPETWAMMLLGLAAVAGIARRNR